MQMFRRGPVTTFNGCSHIRLRAGARRQLNSELLAQTPRLRTTSTSTTPVWQPPSAATSQIVTLPPIPELFDPNFLDVLLPTSQDATELKETVAEVPHNAMMEALRSTAHQKLTTNHAPAFSSTLAPTLDAYLGLRTGISGSVVDRYLENAWAEDPNMTLRIIWSTRSIHDGKGEKELFYRAFGWLFENHPRTAVTNLHCLVDPVCLSISKDTNVRNGAPHGYWKDLLNILALATLGELRPTLPLDPRSNFLHNYYDGKSRPEFKNNQEQEVWSRAQRVERSHSTYDRLAKKLLDKRYRALYVTVARLFASQLARDSDAMGRIAALPADADNGDRMALARALTLVSKWAPTPGGSHDRVTNISSAICLLLHRAQVPLPVGHTTSFSQAVMSSLPAYDMHLLRSSYQKHVLARGRRYTRIPETLMSSNRWSEIAYSRVPSICMNKNKGNFFVHDEERFLNYLEGVQSGKKRISGATLLPHVLAIEATRLYRDQSSLQGKAGQANASRDRKRRLVEAQMRVVDAQWATLLERLRESGQLDNSIAICDVSGSMGSVFYIPGGKSSFNVEPIWPSISLSLLVARLAKPPFNDSFITFSRSPQFVTLDPESSRVSLGATIDGMSDADWAMNTDFNAVFLKLILPLAVKYNVPKDQMIKRIFVFSDMQFNEANTRSTQDADLAAEWKTNHDVIAEAYAEAGYDVPELVYWNLSNPRDGLDITTPVTGNREGVALLSGYSPSLLKLFMDVEDDLGVPDKEGQPEKATLTPLELMKKALGRKSYNGLIVVD